MAKILKSPVEELNPIFDKLIEETLRKLDISKDPEYKSTALSFLVELWIANP
jgi:hypothetical protein